MCEATLGKDLQSSDARPSALQLKKALVSRLLSRQVLLLALMGHFLRRITACPSVCEWQCLFA